MHIGPLWHPATSRVQLLPGHKRYNLMRRSSLSLLRRRKNCLDIESMLGGKPLADAPDSIDNGISRHNAIHSIPICNTLPEFASESR
jgi:hypothetical protein